MKPVLAITLCVVFAAVAWARPDDDGKHYTPDFDTLDVDEVLKNERVFDHYFNCLKTGQRCPKLVVQLRELLHDALKTKCSQCTELQKTKTLKIANWIIKNKPEGWLEIEEVFDKEHVYRTDYADELKTQGITFPPLKS